MKIHETIEIIENNPHIFEMLKYCPYEILKRWEIKKFQKNCYICKQGEVYNYFYVIVEGYIDIYIMSENGKKYSQAVYKKGDYIGELEIFDNKPYGCFVQALTDSKLLVIKRDYFLQWLEMDRNISGYITRTLCDKFYRLSKKAGEDTLYSLKQRLCSFLLSCSRDGIKKADGVQINIKKEQLGEQFAVTQRSINRILRHLKEKNMIEVKNDYIVLKDIAELKAEEKTSRFG